MLNVRYFLFKNSIKLELKYIYDVSILNNILVCWIILALVLF